MKGLWLEENRISLRSDLPVPPVPPGEVLVKVRLAGICKTDLELVKGYYPFRGVPGHEFVGEISDPGDSDFPTGQRVVGEINAVCGKCEFCLRGRGRHCRNRTVLGIVGRHGAFAEYLILPSENLHPVPDRVSDREAVFVEPLAAAFRIPDQVHFRPGTTTLVIGAGKLGQLIARVVARTGTRLLVSTRHSWQREILESQGVECLDEGAVPATAFDFVIEATGTARGLEEARRAVRPRGTIVIKSTYRGAAELDFSSIVVDEVALIGSRCGPFPPALRFLEENRFEAEELIEDVLPLEAGPEALERAARSGARKLLLFPGAAEASQ